MILETELLKTEEISLRQVELEPDDPQRKWDPAFHFDILDRAGVQIGGCNLRLGHSEALYYAGNIGYQIDEPYRGHHYAGKACELLFQLARRQGMEYVIIVCAPGNQPSRKTCEWLGGELLEIAELPEDSEQRRLTGESHRCIYKFRLQARARRKVRMLCAVAKLDPASTERLARLRRMANQFGIFPKELHGHITLATYTGEDEAAFIASCKAILSGYGKFAVRYDKVDIWVSVPESESIIVAVPRRETAMAAMQKEIAQTWAADLNEWTQADVWRPHTTLLYAPGADLTAIAAAMQREFAPFTAQVDTVKFSRVNGEIKTIDFAELA